jgi:hypothetical protein
METIQFEVTNFETTYNTFLGWPALSKIMAIPHYTYLVLKMPGLCGVNSIRETLSRLLTVIATVVRQLID